ncbi:hypothetical protein DUI70_5965 [Streptomyces albus]|nr:hypothetical protein DUI70_5965 [Streptomyces albus]
MPPSRGARVGEHREELFQAPAPDRKPGLVKTAHEGVAV